MDMFSLQKYAKAYNFCVYFGNKKISCNKITGIEDAVETESKKEGGRNSIAYRTTEQTPGVKKLTIERAMPRTTALMKQVTGKVPSMIKTGQEIENKEVSVYLLNESKVAYRCSRRNVP